MNALVAMMRWLTALTLAGQPATGPVGPSPAPVAVEPAPVTAEPAPATSAPPPATQPDRHPVRSSSGWDDEPIAPAPVVTPATAPATDVPPPPPQPRPKDRVGSALLGTGGAFVAVGASSLVFIAMPSAIVKRVALNRASRDPVWDVGTRKDRYRRARRADDAMEAGFWIGVAGLTAGITLIIVGAVVKTRFKRRMAESRVAAAPGGLAIRF